MSANPEQSKSGEGSQEVSHEITLFAEPIFHLGKLVVTNSLLNAWVSVVILVLFFVAAGQKIRRVPKGVQNIFETILEKALVMADSITGNRKKSEKYLPLSLTLFFFVLVNNWLGLVPGVGTIGFIEVEGAHKVFVPLFRGATADLNTTLALALFSVLASHILGSVAVGAWSHLNKFVNIKSFLAIPKKIRQDFSVVLVNPIKAFVGLIEVVSEVSKVASLSFRLFGNIFAGEVLLASMMALVAFIIPLPFMFLEIIVGLIQALIFAILTLVFVTIATTHEEH
jgi:F-type H+-transporting ATPase subunit a